MKLNAFYASALLALTLSLWIFARITIEHQSFQRSVRQSLETTEGYDQKFIDLVNRLEDVLTTRASFSYPGNKDPMTGRNREVATFVQPVKKAIPAKFASGKAAAPTPKVEAPAPIRLSAAIADDYGRYTAIVMNGERSMSVDIGDIVAGQKVIRISAREIAMEDSNGISTYAIDGSHSYQKK